MSFKNNKPYDDIVVGAPVRNIEKLVDEGDKSNANMFHNPETCHKYVADAATKQYALLKMLPADVAESHINGYIHCHDLEYLYARSINCMQHDLRFFIENGLKVDGGLGHTSVAGPPNRLSVALNHAGQVMGAGQTNLSGGQSVSAFNTFLAPFAVGMDYDDIKQNMQSFIYNLNQAYVSRGGQAVFSSVNMDFSVPKFLINEPAYSIGGKIKGTYGDYEDEMREILLAFTDVMMGGDYLGKPFLFPNTVYRIEGKPEDDLLEKVCELSAKFSIPYFTKAIDGELYHNVMGCRTALRSNWTGDPNIDCFRTGNLAYVSLNMVRYALKGDFYGELDRALETAKHILLIRKEVSGKLLNKTKMMPFLSQLGSDGKPYYRLEDATLGFGIVGLSDAVRVLTGYGLESPEGIKKGLEIMQYINDYAVKLVEEDGDRWTVLGSPAESTAHRFAMEDRRKYRDRAPTHGTTGGYYYTNSTHVDVDSGLNLVQRIKAEEQFHKLTSGGAIFHGYMGDAWVVPEAMVSLTKKMIDHSDLGFWALTTAYSVCKTENKLLKGIHETCECGSETEIYSRVTGYLQKVSGWNKGKQSEFVDRRLY